MQISKAASIVVFLVGMSVFGQTEKQIFFLEDAAHHQWCAFRSEAEWKFKVDASTAMTVATAKYLDGQLSGISVTDEDQTGDWIVYDYYSLGQNGDIHLLKRTINILPGDRSQEETYLVANGKATKQRTVRRRLSTKEILSPDHNKFWVPNLPVVTKISGFPFSSLIPVSDDRYHTGTTCAPMKD